jgi:hypothetical protein
MRRREFLRLASLASGAVTFASPNLLHADSQSESASSTLPDDALFQQFLDPPARYRPMVRWWWNGDRVVAHELLRELDVLKAAGIGGFEINPIKFPGDGPTLDTHPLQYLGQEWLDVLEIVLKGARQRGLTCDMIVGSGWPFGGEFLNRADQSQMVALGTRNVTGPARLELTRTELLADVHPALVSPQRDPLKELFSLALAPTGLNTLTQVTSLNNHLTNEHLVLDIPEGQHVLYFLVKLTGYMAVINGAPGANGPVLNHLDKAAVERYLDRIATALTAKLGDLHPYVRAFFTDSIELEGANWFSGMATTFQQRHGYDLLPWLPFILFKVGQMGNAVSGHYGSQFSPAFQQSAEAVRYDFQTLRREVFNESFVSTFAAWCTRHGVKSRMQAYGSECDVMTASPLLDIPECETWLRSEQIVPFDPKDYDTGRNYTMINKFVSSAAHLSGKQVISCEEMTNTDDPFGVSLNQIKAAGDQNILSGVTASVLHGFNYSPPEIPFPGWVRYGTYFSEHNTWWPYFHLWADHKARIYGVLQNSVMYADIAILPPTADLASRFGFQRDPFPQVVDPPYLFELWEVIHQNGSGCDYVTEDILAHSEIKKGKIHYEQRSYKAILLPDVERLHPNTANVLSRFVAAGGTVILLNKIPSQTPGMADQKQASTVASLMSELPTKFPQRAVLTHVDSSSLLPWFRDIQQRLHLTPDVSISDPKDFVSQVHYLQPHRDIFFFTNYSGDQVHTFQAQFAQGHDRTPWLWDTQTGSRHPLAWSPTDGTLSVTLGPVESMLIVLERRHIQGDRNPIPPSSTHSSGTTQPLEAQWHVRLEPVSGQPQTLNVPALTDPSLNNALKSFAGTITCSATVAIDDPSHCSLELGVLHSVSELSVNGQSLGVRWFGNQTYDLSGAAVAGPNDLKLRLTTTLGNYVKTLNTKRTAMDWASDTPFYPSGFLHGVMLRRS